MKPLPDGAPPPRSRTPIGCAAPPAPSSREDWRLLLHPPGEGELRRRSKVLVVGLGCVLLAGMFLLPSIALQEPRWLLKAMLLAPLGWGVVGPAALLMIVAHPARPGVFTAVLTCFGLALWFGLGVLTVHFALVTH